MISVVIPLYNKEKQVLKTLESVMNQTFREFEVIVVNDGSTDGSLRLVQSLKDERIRIIDQANRGVSAARNTGIREARYPYVALLDADDEWMPEYLSTQAGLIRSFPDCRVYACAYRFRNHEGKESDIILNKLPFRENRGVLSNYFEVAACSHPPICSINIVASKEAFLAIGGFPEGITTGEDLLTWAKLALAYAIAYDRTPLVYFNQAASGNYQNAPSRRPEEEDVAGRELETLYRDNKHTKGFSQYLSLWHKMRASMFLLLGAERVAFRECCRSLKYNWRNKKVWVYLLLLFFPLSFRYKVFQRYGNA